MKSAKKNQGNNRKRDAEGRYESVSDSGSNASHTSGNHNNSFNPKQHPRDEEGRFTQK